jgi:hypothetical protein
VNILTTDEFIRMEDLAIAHIGLVEVFATEAENEVGPLEPGDDVGENEDGKEATG